MGRNADRCTDRRRDGDHARAPSRQLDRPSPA